MLHTGVRGSSGLRWEVQLRHEIWLQQEEEISPETRVESILTQHLQTSSGAATISSSGGTLEKQLNVWDNTITLHATITIVCTSTQYTGAETGLVDSAAY